MPQRQGGLFAGCVTAPLAGGQDAWIRHTQQVLHVSLLLLVLLNCASLGGAATLCLHLGSQLVVVEALSLLHLGDETAVVAHRGGG